MEDKIREEVEEMVGNLQGAVEGILKRCESPIEKLLLAGFIKDHLENFIWDVDGTGGPPSVTLRGGVLKIQEEIKIGRKKIRPDFIYQSNRGEYTQVVIECDGHEFHEKNKDQVDRDNRRDIDLQCAGFVVARFSGSQIFKNFSEIPGDVVEVARSVE